MTTAIDFFERTEINGALTPEQAAELMQLAEQGDTGAASPEQEAAAPEAARQAEPSAPSTPEPSAEKPSNSNTADNPPAGEPGPANAVILARDGKHTIPYQKLLEARQGEQHWRAQAEAAQQQLSALQRDAQARADQGQAPTRTDNMVEAAQAAIDAGADASIFGDFSEEALAKGIQTLVDQRVQSAVGKALQPLREQQQAGAVDAHYQAIFKAHPDANSIAQSVEMDNWIKAQPSYAQAAMRGVLEGGATEAVIELFDDFKKATGATAPPPKPTDQQRRAAAATAAQAQIAVPPSLSAIPGGRVAGTSVQERLDTLDPAQLGAAMADMSPAAIEAFLNRSI